MFHWISENKYVQRFHFIMHGSHHLYPRDTERLLMPPAPGLIMATLLFSIFYLIFSILGYPVYTWGFFPGFFLGYLLYSFLHRATHVVKPPKRFKFLWRHHSLHHYKYPDNLIPAAKSKKEQALFKKSWNSTLLLFSIILYSGLFLEFM